MSYYHNLITRQSWDELKILKSRMDFILIGGWAVYLYTQALKSKDIDIITGFDQLSHLSEHYELVKNDRLKKYEARRDPVQIDVYLPHYSRLGIPVEELQKKSVPLKGFTVLDSGYLLALKMYTLVQRGRSAKGKKDFLDIVALFHLAGVEVEEAKQLLKQHKLDECWPYFVNYASDFMSLPELDLNRHQYARWRERVVG